MSFGTDMEQYVAQGLRALGATCIVNTKTPGATDVMCTWPTGTSWRIQVKSTEREDTTPPWPNNEEIRRLKMTATRNNQTPVVAWVFSNGAKEFHSARNGKLIYPPDTRKRRQNSF